jgi:hypothetical protein
MYFNFNKGKRIENNLAETKTNFRKNFVIVGTDSKGKAFTTTVKDVTLIDAKNQANDWAKSHSLVINSVRAV